MIKPKIGELFTREESREFIRDEEAIMHIEKVNKDGSVTVEVEVFLYGNDGKTYSGIRKMRLK